MAAAAAEIGRVLLVIGMCVLLPALVTSRSISGKPFTVLGRVYCDTCRCGFETSATQYLAGARVGIQCLDRDTMQPTYSVEGVTDSLGNYKIVVPEDRNDDICDAVLLKSPDSECATPNKGRDRARVILTRNNGIVSDTRYANAMGFLKNVPLASCTEILKQYKLDEDEI